MGTACEETPRVAPGRGDGAVARRLTANPILSPEAVRPSHPDLVVECLLNPGAFVWNGITGLLLRVAERPRQEEGWVSTPVLSADGEVEVRRFRTGDPDLDLSDPRLIRHRGMTFLTTLSHLRLAWSPDGVKFAVEDNPALVGAGPGENFGVEDARVVRIGDSFHITYTAVSDKGHGVGMARTKDWAIFERCGMILPPPNKDCAIFERAIDGRFWMHHRPTTSGFAGNCIWAAESEDLVHWSGHRFVAAPRPGSWDEGRVGAGAAPIETGHGWLSVYHGATRDHRYCLGLLLLDLNDPSKVLARSAAPVMQPDADYEASGFLGGVIFTNGHVVDGDRLTIYYGAADHVVCAAEFSLGQLLSTLI
ncbi:MAG: glycoside hydrolase family 130 protein [Chthoniobacterales bacterium]|nr:glycoside hydrolase family 130 protein [Chthoniobacterales bacterium]